LDFYPKQPRERVGFSITERRELGCDVLNRAMALSQLDTGQGHARVHGLGGGSEAIGTERHGKCLSTGGYILARRVEQCGIPRLELCTAFAGKFFHCVGTGVFGEKAQR
jgi:hypothetical protein